MTHENDGGGGSDQPSLPEAIQDLKRAEERLVHARADEIAAEHDVEEAIEKIEKAEHDRNVVEVHVVHVNEVEKASFKEKISATLNEVWDNHLIDQFLDILESKEVRFTSIDVLRIGFAEESVFPVVVWIGAEPGTLSREDGCAVANECKQLLVAKKIHDVEVEIRESVVRHLV